MKSLTWVFVFFQKVRFLENKHNHVLEKSISLSLEIERMGKDLAFKSEIFYPRTKMSNKIISKGKTKGDERGLGYVRQNKTSNSEKTIFVNGQGSVSSPKASIN